MSITHYTFPNSAIEHTDGQKAVCNFCRMEASLAAAQEEVKRLRDALGHIRRDLELSNGKDIKEVISHIVVGVLDKALAAPSEPVEQGEHHD